MHALTTRAAGGALAYLAMIFALGFAMGAVRTLWLEPRIGPAPAVLVEHVPMLAACWFVARRITRRLELSRSECAAMGALAFALLMALESGVAVAMDGTAQRWASSLATLPGALGLAGQLAFGLMPVLAARRDPGPAPLSR